MDVSLLLNEATRNRLKKLFLQLDTDKDGYEHKNEFLSENIFGVFRHLTYPQVQKCLPPNLPRAQETFFRVVSFVTFGRIIIRNLFSYMILRVRRHFLVCKNSMRQPFLWI